MKRLLSLNEITDFSVRQISVTLTLRTNLMALFIHQLLELLFIQTHLSMNGVVAAFLF